MQKNNPKLLVPSLSEIFYYSLVSFCILCLINVDKLINSLGLSISPLDLPHKLAAFYENVISNIFPNLANIVVWAICGMGTYFIIWIIVDSIIKVDEINLSRTHRFIYPSKQSKRVFIFTIAGQLFLRLVASIVLVLWIFLLFKLISSLSTYFYENHFSYSTIISPFLMGAYLFAGSVTLRLMVLRPRVLSDNK